MEKKEKNSAAVALGKLGGKARAEKAGSAGMAKAGRKGAKARAEALTPERRKEIARQAIAARWERVRAAKQADFPPVGTENPDTEDLESPDSAGT
jgi:hypothetical protein